MHRALNLEILPSKTPGCLRIVLQQKAKFGFPKPLFFLSVQRWWWFSFVMLINQDPKCGRQSVVQADCGWSCNCCYCWLEKRLHSRLWIGCEERILHVGTHRAPPTPVHKVVYLLWVVFNICITQWWSPFEKSAWCFLTTAYLWYKNVFVLKGRNFPVTDVCNVSLEPILFSEGKYLS